MLCKISEAYRSLTPCEIEKDLTQKPFGDKKEIKKAIKELVADRQITYSYKYGSTFLEKSFNNSVRISKHIVLKPPEISFQKKPDDVVVNISQGGASFGSGNHPTTRLAARGIEKAIKTDKLFKKKKNLIALDVGTGSGVLVITAVLMGINHAIGIDSDPIAIKEAKENVVINGLKDQIEIYNRPLEDFSNNNINNKFSLITANLRYPTLKSLYFIMKKLTKQGSVLVLSGIKTSEIKDLEKTYAQDCFKVKWKECEKDWAVIVLQQ